MNKIQTAALLVAMVTGGTLSAQTNNDKERMLDRFLAYVRIESQSTYPDDPEKEFHINEGQKQIAQHIYNELKGFDGVSVRISPTYYIYAKLPANTHEPIPSVCFMAHMDVSPEVNGRGIAPQVIRKYGGGDIALGTSGLTLSPDSIQGLHLIDVIGHTIVTSSGTTNLGADDKTGCAILLTMLEQLSRDRTRKHGDVYVCLTQNEDVGTAAYALDMTYFDEKPDIMIDVDGGDAGFYGVANFTAMGRTYRFCGNQRHPGDGKKLGYVDAQTALSCFIGHLPAKVNPMFSEGRQGYIQAYIIDDLNNGDYRVKFRIRYFEKSDSALYMNLLDKAERQTLDSFPGLRIELEASYKQYDNVEYSMHPSTIAVIEQALKNSSMHLKPNVIRAGTTGAMCAARGLPAGPCLYSGQNAEHTVYEWASIDELVMIKELCLRIVDEVAKLKKSKDY